MTEGSRPSPKSAMKVVIFNFLVFFVYFFLHFRIFVISVILSEKGHCNVLAVRKYVRASMVKGYTTPSHLK